MFEDVVVIDKGSMSRVRSSLNFKVASTQEDDQVSNMLADSE